MNQVLGTIQNGNVVLDSQVEWPDGTRVELHAVTSDVPKHAAGEEFDRLLDKLADLGEATIDLSTPPLSDYAVSREGIYGDHP